MIKIINKEEMWKVLYSNLDYLRLSAEGFDSDKLFRFAKNLLVELIKVENKEFVKDLSLIDALLGEPKLSLPNVFGEIDELVRKYSNFDNMKDFLNK